MSEAIDPNSLTLAEQRELLGQLLRDRAAKSQTFPMSEGQQGLWHAFRRDPQSSSFNVFLPVRFRSAIDLTALRRSIELVVRRHTSLRTVFADRRGELTQEIRDDLKPEISVMNMRGQSEAAVREAVAAHTVRPFDLERGPLIRVHVFELAATDWVVLAITHHIVVDFWSLVIVLDELRTAYPAYVAGRQPRLPAPENNTSQFVADQQQLLSGPQRAKLQTFWQQQTGRAAHVLEIVPNKIRPSTFRNRAANQVLDFPPGIVGEISAFAAGCTATSYAVVQAALQVFLGRYSGQSSFYIGNPCTGRVSSLYENTIGFFINMLPLRVDLEGNPSFFQLTGRVQRNLLEALEHEAYPISMIVQDARTLRDPSRSPLFQVSCTFEKSHVRSEVGRAAFLFPRDVESHDFGGLKQEGFYVPHPTCHYDLEFIFEQSDQKLLGMICYCDAIFDADSMACMATNFSQLLQSLLREPELPISQVAWAPTGAADASRSRSVAPVNLSCMSSGPAKAHTVDAMIQSAVARHAGGCALKFSDGEWTYSQLWNSANHIAQRLRSLLVVDSSKDSAADSNRAPAQRPLVAVCTQSGPRALLGMLAAHLAQVAVVPVDLSQPTLNASDLLADTRAAACLGDVGHAYLAHVGSIPTIDIARMLDTDGPALPLPNAAHHDPNSESSSLAYVVYTSGSTGSPKGVMVDHAAVCNTLAWRQRAVPLRAGDRVLMLLSHQFDAGLGIAWTTLTQGASLVWADSSERLDPEALIAQIIRDRITVLPAVPSLLRVLVSDPGFRDCQSLRLIFTGGEAMPPDLPSLVRSATKARFWNFYGPTEAAIEATACDVTDHDPTRPVPIGNAIDNIDVWVLDEHHRPLPTTVPGELAIAGVGLARGYLNNSELTKQRFVMLNDPQAGTSIRVYLTGDRGRRLPSGQFEFLGRSDHQIKLHGYRIELGEIESILERHPLVQRAAAKLVDAGTHRAQLLAFVSLRAGASLPAPSVGLRRYAREHLPRHKVPSAVLVVQHMPITSSGKVDRQRLPSAVPMEFEEEQFVAPRTPLEEYLSSQWCASLQIEKISTNMNFFDAGGSSLQAAVLTSQLSQELGVQVPTALLFDLLDIAQLAGRLVQLHSATMEARFGATCVTAHRSQLVPTGLQSAHPLIAALKTTGSKPPIFMVHPPGGIVVCYRELARYLDSDQPLYAIRARGLHGQEELPANLKAMASDYVAAIASVQPQGPYTLGGWSLGGLVAYEMAQQLHRAGESVSQLLLLDTTIPEGSTDLVPATELGNVGLEYGIELNLDQLSRLAPEDQLPFLWEHAKHLGVIDDQSPPEVIARVLHDLQSLFHHHVKLSQEYRLEPLLAQRIELFRPREVPVDLPVSQDRGWRHLADSVAVHFVPGHHHSMVQPPHVESLAGSMTSALASHYLRINAYPVFPDKSPRRAT